MKSGLLPKSRPKPKPVEGLTFVKVGTSTGIPVADLQARLADFHAKYPESRRTLRKGQKSTVALVKEARDRR